LKTNDTNEEIRNKMSKFINRILLLIIFVFSLQTAIFAAKVTGYYITRNNDTVYATIKVPVGWFTGEISYISLQSKIKYYNSTGKKVALRPADAKKVYFEYDGETVVYLSCENTIGLWTSLFDDGKYIFLKLEIDGPLRLFTYYRQQQSGGYYNGTTWTGSYSYTIEKYVLQKNGRELFRPAGMFFKKDMAAYLSDYPELAQKVLNKEFRQRDMEEIVEEYNRWKASPRPSPKGEGDAPK
jgi:hypothetical protein